MGLLELAVHTLPIGTAYAVYRGIGTLATVAAGAFSLGESASAPRLVCVLLIVFGFSA